MSEGSSYPIPLCTYKHEKSLDGGLLWKTSENRM